MVWRRFRDTDKTLSDPALMAHVIAMARRGEGGIPQGSAQRFEQALKIAFPDSYKQAMSMFTQSTRDTTKSLNNILIPADKLPPSFGRASAEVDACNYRTLQFDKVLSSSMVHDIVRRWASFGGIGDVSPHDLSRTAITRALDRGLTYRQVQMRSKHKYPKTVMHCDHGREGLAQNAVDC
jgi:hypothetical protein